VHARDHDVDAREHLVVVVERAVLEDVDLDAREDAERRELLVERRDDLELLGEAVTREPVRDREARRVVGEREVLVPERPRLLAIARIVWPPSDQSEWLCRSPRSRARSASPASVRGRATCSRSFAR
jgi:hypothetical protein